MKITFTILSIFFFGSTISFAQRAYLISRISTAPAIDGIADDSIWQQIPIADGFTTTLPHFGQVPQLPTIVKMGYTDQYIYITATCQSGKVRNDGSERDESGQGDYFSVGFDTWNDDQNSFNFTVTAAGQLIESNNGSNTYFAPWAAATTITADGWTVEMKIPFVALRYPKGDQPWGLQFSRFDRSTGETSTWNPQNPAIEDKVWQYGALEGLNLSGKMRYRMMSVLSDKNLSYSINTSEKYPNEFAGIGLYSHWALGSASTLDIAVMPPVGIYYNLERTKNLSLRSYPGQQSTLLHATESNLFSKYSLRDIFPFSTPSWYNPKLIAINNTGPIVDFKYGQNATEFKLTHRTRNNWIFGTTTTICLPTYVVSENYTTGKKNTTKLNNWPVYNYTAAEKIFRNNAFLYFGLSSSVIGDHQNHNTLVSGGKWRDRSNTYEISGHWYLNLQNASVKRLKNIPDGDLAFRKANGAWRWGVSYTANGNPTRGDFSTQQFINPLKHKNWLDGNISHQNYAPKWRHLNLVRHSIDIASGVNEVDENLKYHRYFYNLLVQDQHFRNYSFSIFTSNKRGNNSINLGDGVVLTKIKPPSADINWRIATDTRKKWQGAVMPGFTIIPGTNRFRTNLGVSFQWRISPSWSISDMAEVYFIHKTPSSFTNTVNQYFVRYINSSQVGNNLYINYIPGNRMAFRLGVDMSPDIYSTIVETFLISPDLQFIPVDNPFYKPDRTDEYQLDFAAFLFGRSGSKYAFHFSIYQARNKSTFGPVTTVTVKPQVQASINFMYNFAKYNSK